MRCDHNGLAQFVGASRSRVTVDDHEVGRAADLERLRPTEGGGATRGVQRNASSGVRRSAGKMPARSRASAMPDQGSGVSTGEFESPASVIPASHIVRNG